MRDCAVKVDLWALHKYDPMEEPFYVCIPVNGNVKGGKAIMGTGLARQANMRFNIAADLAKNILKYGGAKPCLFQEIALITVPTKNNFWEPANLTLIRESCKELQRWVDHKIVPPDATVVVPRFGCGAGRLKWESVRTVMYNELKSDQFLLCEP